MSMEFYDEREVTARKHHRCEYCHGEIKQGERYKVEKGKFYGDFFSRACCSSCLPHASAFWESVDNECGHIQSDFCEFLAECPNLTGGYWPDTFGEVPDTWNKGYQAGCPSPVCPEDYNDPCTQDECHKGGKSWEKQ